MVRLAIYLGIGALFITFWVVLLVIVAVSLLVMGVLALMGRL